MFALNVLLLGLLSPQAFRDLGRPEVQPERWALAIPARGAADQAVLIPSETADDESEDKDFDPPGPAAEFLPQGSDARRIVTARRSEGTPHLRTFPDRRGRARSPPAPHSVRLD
jgi:hypothetical protein